MKALQLLLIDPNPEISDRIRGLLDPSHLVQVDLVGVRDLHAAESFLDNGDCDLILMYLSEERAAVVFDNLEVITHSVTTDKARNPKKTHR